MAIPETVYQSTTFAASIACSDYPSSEWDGELRLVQSGSSDIELTGTAADDGVTHEFSADTTATDGWAAGSWNWAFIATKGLDTFVAARGELTVTAIGADKTELASAKETLADVRAAIALASGRPSSYSIKDRSLTHKPVSELLQLESYFSRRVFDLQTQADRDCSEKTGNRRIIYAKFTK